MISAITVQLLLVLIAAAFLGFLIGLFGMRLHHLRAQKRAHRSKQLEVEQLTTQRKELSAENDKMKLALESEQKLSGILRGKQSQLSAQQETLQVHSGLQEKRIEKMTAELHTSEEKCIRLQRDFASFKANKLREVRMLKVSSDEWLDNEELPVLNKKVDQASVNNDSSVKAETKDMVADEYQPSLDETQPIIASELDIPSLAESELPDSVEELEFELVEHSEPD